jgi:hypothetical protein
MHVKWHIRYLCFPRKFKPFRARFDLSDSATIVQEISSLKLIRPRYYCTKDKNNPTPHSSVKKLAWPSCYEGKKVLGTLNPFLYPVRAEDMKLSLLKRLMDNLHWPLDIQWKNVYDFLDSGSRSRYFLLGLKGWGKTLSVLCALNAKIEDDTDFVPLMLHFDIARRQIGYNDPLKMASRETWGQRLKSYSSLNKALDTANCIVFDDLHYIFESLAMDTSILPSFLYLFETVLQKAENGIKVLLISEDLLFLYAEILKNKTIDALLNKFDLTIRLFPEDLSLDEIDPIAFHEVHYFNQEQWEAYLSLYGKMTLDPLVAYILFNISHSPRALIKIAKLFHVEHITNKLFFKVAIERLTHAGIDQETLELYEWLMFNQPYYESTSLQGIHQIGLRAKDVKHMYLGMDPWNETGVLYEPFELAYAPYLREQESALIVSRFNEFLTKKVDSYYASRKRQK